MGGYVPARSLRDGSTYPKQSGMASFRYLYDDWGSARPVFLRETANATAFWSGAAASTNVISTGAGYDYRISTSGIGMNAPAPVWDAVNGRGVLFDCGGVGSSPSVSLFPWGQSPGVFEGSSPWLRRRFYYEPYVEPFFCEWKLEVVTLIGGQVNVGIGDATGTSLGSGNSTFIRVLDTASATARYATPGFATGVTSAFSFTFGAIHTVRIVTSALGQGSISVDGILREQPLTAGVRGTYQAVTMQTPVLNMVGQLTQVRLLSLECGLLRGNADRSGLARQA